jgi:glycosyltransferase involved in cell wall biosynthesis
LGQIAEVLTDQKTGLLYAPGNLDQLTACCDRLLTDSALRQRLGQAGAKLVHERFTWDHNARFIVELAASLVTPRSSSQPNPSAASSTAASQ